MIREEGEISQLYSYILYIRLIYIDSIAWFVEDGFYNLVVFFFNEQVVYANLREIRFWSELCSSKFWELA